MQTKTGSFIESCTNVAIGITIGFIANLIVLPAFGYPVTVADGFMISLVFTAISLIRSYLIRRWFTVKQLFVVRGN